MEEKMQDPEFVGDTTMLLRPDINYKPKDAYDIVYDTLINKI